jgi:selenide,water dikinase
MTGASARNWAGYGDDVRLGESIGELERALLTDPQTSGGLLVACDPSTADALVEEMRAAGFEFAARIGRLQAPAPGTVPGRVLVR